MSYDATGMKEINSVPIEDGLKVIMIIILPIEIGALYLSLSFPHLIFPSLPPTLPFPSSHHSLTFPCQSFLLPLVSNSHSSILLSSPLPFSPLTESPLVCTSCDKLHESAVSSALYRMPYTVYGPVPVLPLPSIIYHRSRDSRTLEGLVFVLLQLPLYPHLLLRLLLLLLLEHWRR